MASAFSKLQAFRFATILSKPFEEWDAFKFGLIDEKGNFIKKPKTKEEKKSLDAFTNLIRKIKKLLIRYIPDNKLFQFMIAAYLLKTESNDDFKNGLYIKIFEEINDTEEKMLYNVLDTASKIDWS